ncbi:TPA: Arc family DNA-binding protein [Klebsiella pneumoniae]
MSEKQVRDYDKFMLRFPDGMREAIAERAKRNGRSMNSEIVQILQDALDKNENALLNDIVTRTAGEPVDNTDIYKRMRLLAQALLDEAEKIENKPK